MNRWTFLIASTLAAAGCGQADLGGDAAPEPSGSEEKDGAPTSMGASGDLVYREGDAANHTEVLAIAGDYLYFPVEHSAGHGRSADLMRCEKTDCAKTAKVVYETQNTIDTLQVFDGRLGIAERGERPAIITCALPDCRVQFRLDGLRDGIGGCHFEADSIEWSHGNDNAVYRCALPDCESGPELLLAGIRVHKILRSKEVTILQEGDNVRRISGDVSTLELLELGEESRTLGNPPAAETSVDFEASVGDVAIDGDWIYASQKGRCETGGFCAIARWPLRGYGPRQVIFDGNRPIPGFSVYRGELAARTYGFGVEPWNATEISVCRTDACSETRRDLLAPGWTSALVSDDERWYWVWNADTSRDMEIRSTPRLDAT